MNNELTDDTIEDLFDAIPVQPDKYRLFARAVIAADRAQRQDAETWSLYIASMVEAYLQSQPATDKREAAIAGIISRRLWALPDRAQRQAEPGAKREQSALDARAASAARAEAFDAQRQAEPAIEFSDPQVQIAYAILADSNATPPAGEHWEGFAARRIVSALRQAEQEPVAWAVYWGIGQMQKNSVHFERATAEEFAGEIKSVTEIRPLYAAPQPAQVQAISKMETTTFAVQAVQEPTEEMIRAGCLSQQATPEYDNYEDWRNSHSSGIVERIRGYLRKDYLAMIAAAPQPAQMPAKDAEIAALKADYLRACQTIAAMHEAATGRTGEAPTLGVVEDVAVLKAELDALRKDAGRYRFLRAQPIEGEAGQPVVAMPNGMSSGYYLNEETADFAIDAAMQAQAVKP